MSDTVAWIAVDWGTSNLRGWAMDGSGAVITARSSPKGMGKLTRSEFPDALAELVSDIPLSGPTQVMVCGMAGARQGWLEAPYLEAPTDLRHLARGAVSPDSGSPNLKVSILPGVCQVKGGDNVMRGEETQLLGLAATLPGYSGLVCMPGTHSKWAMLNGTRIEHFTTAMTGEIFEVLSTYSVLRHSLADAETNEERASGFSAGAKDGLANPADLLGQLFRVRASSLVSGRSSSWCAGYLSGLLIGTEIAANKHQIGNEAVPLIGSHTLCALYGQVLEMAGASGRPVDATAVVLAGLTAARDAA